MVGTWNIFLHPPYFSFPAPIRKAIREQFFLTQGAKGGKVGLHRGPVAPATTRTTTGGTTTTIASTSTANYRSKDNNGRCQQPKQQQQHQLFCTQEIILHYLLALILKEYSTYKNISNFNIVYLNFLLQGYLCSSMGRV